MAKGITFSNKRFGLRNQKPITVYKVNGDDRQLVSHFDSIRHAGSALHICFTIISKHIKSGTPYKDFEFYSRGSDPYAARVGISDEITPEEDLPVISFFRDDDLPVARFKSVTFLHNCIGRPIKTILSWLNGGRCTDPDCYYKYEKDCTNEQLALLNRN